MGRTAPAEARLFLKSLELAGFKSFDRPTRLEFPLGITALVGPNGSGKSNIVDAIRWCLGEQSARDLRGHRAEDVIHAGKHKVLGSAEVGLTFESGPDDVVEWAELAVARRLYRSGESEYLVNKSRERLRDVQASLRTVGIDNPRFVVVNQGMADSLLSATPSERRALLEQAAGLSGYRQRRDEAAGKLTTTEQNIVTIEAVLAELEPRLRSLRRQARAVEDRDEVAARLAQRLQDWYGWRWHALAQELSALQTQVEKAAASRRASAVDLADLEERAESSLSRERDWRSWRDSATSALHVTERDHDAARHDLERAVQRVATLQESMEVNRRRLESVGTEIVAARDRHEGACDALRQLDAEIEATARAAEDLQTKRSEMARRTQSLEHGLNELGREQQRVAAEIARLRENRAGTELEAEHLRTRMEKLDAWFQIAVPELRTLEDEQDRRRKNAADLSASEGAAVDALSTADEALALARQRWERVRHTSARIRNRVGLLRRALREADQIAAGMQESIGGTVLSELHVADGWHRSVAAALGDWAFVPGAEITRAGPDLDEYLQWRMALAQMGAVWADTLASSPVALPALLFGTLVIRDTEQATRLWEEIVARPALRIGSPSIQVVTRDGVAVSAAGTRRHLMDDRAAGYLRARNEHLRLTRMVATWSERQARIQTAEADSRTHVEALTERVAAASRDLQTVRHAVSEARTELERLDRRRGQLIDDQVQRERDRDDIRARLETLRNEATFDQERYSRAATSLQEIERRNEVQQSDMEACRKEAAEISAGLGERSRALDVLRGRRTVEARLVTMLERDRNRLEAETVELLRLEGSLVDDVARVESEREDVAGKLADLETILADQVKAVAEIRSRRPIHEDMREPMRTARARSADAVAAHERAMARQEELVAERQRLVAEIWSELQLQPGRLAVVEREEAPSEEELRKLRSKALQYAELDATVVDEYQELSRRHEYLRAQIEDLRAAAVGLREIMCVSDREMRSRFESALRAVNQEFSHVFRVMLRGGEARLDQIDDDGGIEVRATLPGRRARSNAAFSGGERALVASSLLFGVLRTRPAPFCVLDEVDAALDESNVDRYLAALREISTRTQALVVTHNRATMAAANALYGLTMDGEGASRALSLRLDAYEEAG